MPPPPQCIDTKGKYETPYSTDNNHYVQAVAELRALLEVSSSVSVEKRTLKTGLPYETRARAEHYSLNSDRSSDQMLRGRRRHAKKLSSIARPKAGNHGDESHCDEGDEQGNFLPTLVWQEPTVTPR